MKNDEFVPLQSPDKQPDALVERLDAAAEPLAQLPGNDGHRGLSVAAHPDEAPRLVEPDPDGRVPQQRENPLAQQRYAEPWYQQHDGLSLAALPVGIPARLEVE